MKECRQQRQLAANLAEIVKSVQAGRPLEETQSILDRARADAAPLPGARPSDGWINAADLLRMTFPDPVWLLPDILPEIGCYLLSGKPKKGKSWWALALATAVAQGGRFLDRDAPVGKVFVLALEDTKRRLHARMLTLQPDGVSNPSCMARLDIRIEAPRLGQGLEALLESKLSDGGVRLVVIDKLQKVRAPSSGRALNTRWTMRRYRRSR